MGSMRGNWPSYDPHNFSQLRPSDPAQPSENVFCFLCQNCVNSFHPKKLTAATYHPTHNRTLPPANQVISTEETNILLRQFYQRAEEKLRTKRSAPDNLMPDHGCKQPRGSFEDGPS